MHRWRGHRRGSSTQYGKGQVFEKRETEVNRCFRLSDDEGKLGSSFLMQPFSNDSAGSTEHAHRVTSRASASWLVTLTESFHNPLAQNERHHNTCSCCGEDHCHPHVQLDKTVEVCRNNALMPYAGVFLSSATERTETLNSRDWNAGSCVSRTVWNVYFAWCLNFR